MKKLLAVTTYNRLQLLSKSVESLIECTPDYDELVIADDASDDGTLDYIVELKEDQRDIAVLPSLSNKGVCESINRIVYYYSKKYADCDEPIFLAKMEDDMTYTPGWLDKVIKLFRHDWGFDKQLGFTTGYFAPEHPSIGTVEGPDGTELHIRTEMRGNCMVGQLHYWASMCPIPDIIPGTNIKRGKPNGGMGSHNDWHFLRDHENSVEKTGKVCLIYPGLLKHIGSNMRMWNHEPTPEV